MFASDSFLIEYLPILLFLGIALGITILMVMTSLAMGVKKPYDDKQKTYDCGFASFLETNNKFDVRYYLVCILFAIFDFWIIFLFPWALSLGDIGIFGFWSMMVFLFILLVGFLYEWKMGALEWE